MIGGDGINDESNKMSPAPFIATVLLNTVGFAGVCWAYAICYISGSVISFWIRPEQPGITRKVAAN